MQEKLQKYSSAGTSLNQIPKVAKMLKLGNETVLLDWGCGKYDKFQNFVKLTGASYFGYDPFHKTDADNFQALNCNPNLIVCANVLNVIFEDWIIENIVRKIAGFGCVTYFQIYEGNKSGIGKETSKGYQRNAKSVEYEHILKSYFNEVIRKGNIFICKNI